MSAPSPVGKIFVILSYHLETRSVSERIFLAANLKFTNSYSGLSAGIRKALTASKQHSFLTNLSFLAKKGLLSAKWPSHCTALSLLILKYNFCAATVCLSHITNGSSCLDRLLSQFFHRGLYSLASLSGLVQRRLKVTRSGLVETSIPSAAILIGWCGCLDLNLLRSHVHGVNGWLSLCMLEKSMVSDVHVPYHGLDHLWLSNAWSYGVDPLKFREWSHRNKNGWLSSINCQNHDLGWKIARNSECVRGYYDY